MGSQNRCMPGKDLAGRPRGGACSPTVGEGRGRDGKIRKGCLEAVAGFSCPSDMESGDLEEGS